MYEYKVIGVPRVIDGDTFDLDIDLGFYASLRIRIRLADIDTYEIFGKNAHELGPHAKDASTQWLTSRLDHGILHVRTQAGTPDTPIGDGSFGRWLGIVYDADTYELLSDYLKQEGFNKQ